MSKCVVHGMKMKMSAVGGIQSHNQREHESKKNKDIDYSKSSYNYDIINDKNISYRTAVKNRIAELNLKKNVRNDAVVYYSFIISSDQSFFYHLGDEENSKRVASGEYKESDFYYDKDVDVDDDLFFRTSADVDVSKYRMYQDDCFRQGSKSFFQDVYDFFANRYGAENMVNATVHMDETTPHMHLGLVPVTADGRLCAKEIFTPTELRNLQTDFYKYVGAKYGLERGVENSKAKHLDEINYKIKAQEENFSRCDRAVNEKKQEISKLESKIDELNTSVTNQQENLLSIQNQINKYISEFLKSKRKEQAQLDAIRAETSGAMTNEYFISEFLKQPNIKMAFEQFCQEQEEKIKATQDEHDDTANNLFSPNDWLKMADIERQHDVEQGLGKYSPTYYGQGQNQDYGVR